MIFVQLCYLAIGLSLWRSASGANVDLTVVAGSTGESVVEAAIQKLEAIPGLFSNDFGFLKRIALAESNFGSTLATAASPNGGIWQITDMIQSRLNTSDAQEAVGIAEPYLGAESVALAEAGFSTPMKSAFAARLFIDIVRGKGSMSTSLSDQATWWITHYHPGESQNSFVQIVERYENITSCNIEKLDLWFLLDGSGSIGSTNFQQSLDFVQRTAEYFNISQDQVRTGLMIYSGSTSLISYFNEHLSNDEFTVAVQATSYPGGSTNTGAAIAQVDSDGFVVSNGARVTSEGVPRVLVVLTDGKSHDDVVEPSEQIKSHGVLVYSVGVGDSYNKEEITSIGSTPAAQYVFELARFDDLVGALTTRLQQACDFPVALQDNIPVDFNVIPGDTDYSQVQLNTSGSVVLNFDLELNSSIGVVFISGTVPKPSPVIHDATFNLSGGVVEIVVSVDLDDLLSVSVSLFTNKQKDKQKRNVKNTLGSRPIYVAMKSTGENPLRLQLTATASPNRVTETTPSLSSSAEGTNRIKFNGNALTNAVLAMTFSMLYQ